MTTDITELEQREKFEAWARSQKLSLSYGDCGYVFSSTEMAWRAWRASSSELVEALEKAQRANAAQGDHINQQQDRIEQLEKKNAELGKYAGGLESFRTAYMEWSDKTDWVQTDKRFDVLKPWGKHRADVLKAYIEHLESRTFTAAAADLLAERQRQVTTEGWAPAHDDEYEHGELADAAGCYALSSELFDCAGEPPRPWPWPDEWWKPTSRRRDLVKAGALILAEIERIDRAAGVDVREAE